MPLMERECTICGHKTQQVSGCGRIECELAESTGVEGIHDHCAHDQPTDPSSPSALEAIGHALCTPRGCRGVAVPTGHVNPDIVTGEVGPKASARDLRELVTEATGHSPDEEEIGP